MEGLANWATRRSLLLQRRFALAREQPKAMKSRMTRECHVRICEGLGVKFPGATRPTGTLELGLFQQRCSMNASAIMTA